MQQNVENKKKLQPQNRLPIPVKLTHVKLVVVREKLGYQRALKSGSGNGRMATIVCEATGRAEGKGGFFRRRKNNPAQRESGSGVEKGGGDRTAREGRECVV